MEGGAVITAEQRRQLAAEIVSSLPFPHKHQGNKHQQSTVCGWIQLAGWQCSQAMFQYSK